MNSEQAIFLKLLKKLKRANVIKNQQFKTLKGQFFKGDEEAAKKGLGTILKRQGFE